MAEQGGRRADWGPGGKLAADGVMAGYDKATEVVDRLMAGVPRPARIVIKTIRKAPGGALKGAEIALAKDGTRAVVGAVGGVAGGYAGGLMGAATGPAAPVAIPVGAAVGNVAGQHIAEEVYDDHIEDVRRGIAATKAWIHARRDQLARGALNEFQTYTRPPQARERF